MAFAPGIALLLAAALPLSCSSRGADDARDAAPPPAPRVLLAKLELQALVALEVHAGEVTEVRRLADGALALTGTEAALEIRGPEDRTRTSFPSDGETVAWNVIRSDLDGDGADEFVNRGGNWQPVWVRDATGRLRWRSGWGANALSVADLDGDRISDLVLGMNGGGGVRRLDASGTEVWAAKASNVWHLELAELEASSPGLEILHSQASGTLVVRSAGGSVLRELKPPVPATDFALLGDGGEAAVWLAREGALHRFRLRDGAALAVPLPADSPDGELHAAQVRFAGGGYEAVLVDDRVGDRAFLALVDGAGAPAYLQLLGSSCAFLAPWQGGLVLGCTEQLLVFGPPVAAWSAALAIRELAFGASAPELLEDLTELAGALREADRLSEAEAPLQRAEGIAERLPAGNAERARVANAWALWLEARGEPARARAKLDEALRLLDADTGAEAELRSAVHHNFGRAEQLAGRWPEAERHYRRSLELLHGDEPRGAAAAGAAFGLAEALLAQGRSDEALVWADVALAADQRSYGPEHPEVALDRDLRARIEAARSAPQPASDLR